MRIQWLLQMSIVCGCAVDSIEVSTDDGKADGTFANTFPPLENTLYPFETDGCSSFPDGDWVACCKVHDLAYWAGGTEADRKAADAKLRDCVAATGHAETAQLMFAGVQAFGGPDQIETYRWGFGWRYNRGYKPLTPEQQKRVAALMPADVESMPVMTPTRVVEPYPTLSGNYCNDEAYYGLRSLLAADDRDRLTRFHGVVNAPSLTIAITTNLCRDELVARLSVALLADRDGCETPRYTDEQPTHFLAALRASGDCAALLK